MGGKTADFAVGDFAGGYVLQQCHWQSPYSGHVI